MYNLKFITAKLSPNNYMLELPTYCINSEEETTSQ